MCSGAWSLLLFSLAQFTRVECCNQFALTNEPWNEFLDVADHFSGIKIAKNSSDTKCI